MHFVKSWLIWNSRLRCFSKISIKVCTRIEMDRYLTVNRMIVFTHQHLNWKQINKFCHIQYDICIWKPDYFFLLHFYFSKKKNHDVQKKRVRKREKNDNCKQKLKEPITNTDELISTLRLFVINKFENWPDFRTVIFTKWPIIIINSLQNNVFHSIYWLKIV